MVEIKKTIPNELDGDAKYSVRIRSINSFGVPSDWSEALVVDTTSAGLASAGRLVMTADGLAGYTDEGKLAFGYYSSPGSRVNEVKNPSFEVNTVGWAATPAATLTRNTSSSFFTQSGTGAAALITPSAVPSTNVGMEQTAGHRTAVVANETLTVSAYVRVNIPNKFRIGIRFYNAGGVFLSESMGVKEYTISNLLWTRVSNSAIKVPTGAASAAVCIRSVKTMAISDYYLVDGVLLERGGVLRDYFDGSTSAGNTVWSGTPNASASTFAVNSPYYQNESIITKSVFQTNLNVDTVGGVKIDPLGLYGFDPAGNRKVLISALTGNITATDGIFTGSVFRTNETVGIGGPNAGSGVIFDNNGIKGFSGVGMTPTFSLSTSGAMTAVSGTIGGWVINSTTLTNSNVTLDSAGNIIVGTGTTRAQLSSTDANWRIWVGDTTSGSAPFRVSKTGALFAGSFNLLEGSTVVASLASTTPLDSLLGGSNVPALAMIHSSVAGAPVSVLQWAKGARSWGLGNSLAYVAATGYDFASPGQMAIRTVSLQSASHDAYISMYAGQVGVTQGGQSLITTSADRLYMYGNSGYAGGPGVIIQAATSWIQLQNYGNNALTITSQAPDLQLGNAYSNAWASVSSTNGYLLLGAGGDSAVYLRSKNASSVYIGANNSNTIAVGNGTTSFSGVVNSSNNFASNYTGGSTYNLANFYANGPGGGIASVGFHPGNVACQFRMGFGVQTLYLRGINSGDNNVTADAATWYSSSSREYKQDIVSWPLPPTKHLSAAMNELGPVDPLVALAQVRPVWFRRKEEGYFKRLPKTERRASALMRLQAIRESKGLEPYDSDELRHVCGRDCNWSLASPCEIVRHWETGEVGFISEELGEVLPQATKLDPFTGRHDAVDAAALAAFAIAAVKAAVAKIEILEAQVAELSK